MQKRTPAQRAGEGAEEKQALTKDFPTSALLLRSTSCKKNFVVVVIAVNLQKHHLLSFTHKVDCFLVVQNCLVLLPKS